MSDEMKPVAWLYRNEVQQEYISRQRHEFRTQGLIQWTETPLYTFEQLQGFNRVVDHPATSTPVADHETGNTSDKDLIERVARAIAEVFDSAGLRGLLAHEGIPPHVLAQAAIAAIDLPAQREAAARAALEAAADAVECYMADCLDDKDVRRQWPRTFSRNLIYGELVRAIDPAAFRGGSHE